MTAQDTHVCPASRAIMGAWAGSAGAQARGEGVGGQGSEAVLVDLGREGA
jgi:hypothetical protein